MLPCYGVDEAVTGPRFPQGFITIEDSLARDRSASRVDSKTKILLPSTNGGTDTLEIGTIGTCCQFLMRTMIPGQTEMFTIVSMIPLSASLKHDRRTSICDFLIEEAGLTLESRSRFS
ncbi:hypothetical protein IV203_036892 [Nitzschia inconspicua]|uniref:Uncharacterized protein n=1 Tax=Nitzschia inconspicua TaxID=303405 RepID=A0A9K3LIZ7_9STRA|nr:hypothetical protein IV203_036892 [Nitzschia inconspicua]